jgi:hypothetical protein
MPIKGDRRRKRAASGAPTKSMRLRGISTSLVRPEFNAQCAMYIELGRPWGTSLVDSRRGDRHDG